MFTDFEEAKIWLYNQKKLKKREDLTRISTCIKLLNIKMNYKIIHIAGTNGKGSTATFIANMLKLRGLKVGLFTSPFVVCFNERIQVNLSYISNEKALNYLNQLATFSSVYYEKYKDIIPFFELTFLLALLHFSSEKIDVAVIECGLGGRIDATNVVTSDIEVITNIGYDHMQQLGNSLEKISYHKLGITRPNHHCFTCVCESLEPFFSKYSKENNIIMHFVNKDVSNIYIDDCVHFTYQGNEYMVGMPAKYQAYNASLAIAVIIQFDKTYPKTLIDEALLTTKWPGRFEEIKRNVILDGAHNLPGIIALKESIKAKYPNKRIKVVFTALKDKAIKEMLTVLNEITNYYYFTTIDDKRASNVLEFKQYTNVSFELDNNIHLIINKAINELKEDELLVITGSLHFISEARKILI